MIKYFKDHPAYKRVSDKIHNDIERLRPRTISLAQRNVMSRNPLALSDTKVLVSQVADEVNKIEMSLYKREARRMGLMSKYVGH